MPKRADSSRCDHCGYDTTGLEWHARCPECGGKTKRDAPRLRWARPSLTYLGVFLLVAGVMGQILMQIEEIPWYVHPLCYGALAVLIWPQTRAAILGPLAEVPRAGRDLAGAALRHSPHEALRRAPRASLFTFVIIVTLIFLVAIAWLMLGALTN